MLPQLRINDLRKQRVLTQGKGQYGLPTHMNWGATTIYVRCEDDRLKLTYGPFSKTVHYIGLGESETSFNGRRQWLRCPDCGRRCGVLYCARTAWRCRLCLRLTYQTSYVRPWERQRTKAEKIHIKLRGSGDLDDGIPAKPKGMHRRTYERLAAKCAAEHDAAETAWAYGVYGKFAALPGNIFKEL
jgi:hypothetical protein